MVAPARLEVPGLTQRWITARDGTRIGYQAWGEGPTLVLANGLGGTYLAFHHLYKALAGYRVLCWDYRGLYTSSAPADPLANSVAHQVDDLLEICAAEGVDRFVIIGWSMGVQVLCELHRAHAARVAGVAALNGTSGRAFSTVLSSKIVAAAIPAMLRLIKAQAPLVGRASGAVAGSQALVQAMKRFGLVSDRIDMDVFRHVAAGFRTIDWAIYSDLLARLDEHDAAQALPNIVAPTLVLTGDRDVLTPPSTATAIHRAVPHSRLVVVRGGTHYTPIEFPSVVVQEVLALLATVPGWQPHGTSARVPGGPAPNPALMPAKIADGRR